MTQTVFDSVQAFFRQQLELGMPAFILGREARDAALALSDPAAVGGARSAAAPPPRTQPRPARVYETFEQKRAALVQLYQSMKGCEKCRLAASRTCFVFGAGNAAAPLLIIGEAPGEEEDRQGLPFVGAAGELLDKMLAAIDLDRKKHAFITNVLKCRPPANRNPETGEAAACEEMLARQIEIIAPRAILLLGRIAAQQILKTPESIGKLRTQIHTYNDIPSVVTYHPAALLRNPSYKRPAWEDLQKLQQLLNEIGAYGNSES
jgi:DNA polymerase